MKFTRLRLSGFKSFVDPTELHIENGLTGVVGPNGCGKSNLLEAMRWVMGENRPTTMRGTGMDDVIFGGTGSRPMRNNAEVTLFIDNTDRSAPAPYNEVETIEVTRRIEREAGSVYRINGRDVRQRDVQIFFADASTGSTSPALVRQGQIGVLISQKPLARRAILEEAAGISGLHQRRHEADLRLKAAETNMARLDDIIAEVETQLQGLRRQARQAARYRNLSGLIRKAEALAFLLRWQSHKAQETITEDALKEAVAQVSERTDEAARATTERLEAANALPPLREEEAIRSAALQRLTHERMALDNEETRAREEAQRLRQRIGQAEEDQTRERALEHDAAAALLALDGEAQELTAAQARADTERGDAESRAQECRDVLAECERVLERLTSELAELNAARANFGRVRDEEAARIARTARQLEALAPALAAAEAELAAAPDVRAAEDAVEIAREAMNEARQVAAETQAQRDSAIDTETQSRAPLETAEREAQRLSAEANALAKILRPDDQDLWPPLIDSVRVQPGYESAFAAALGDDLEAPLNESAPHHWRDLGELDPPALPGNARALAEFVEAAPAALARRLAFTGVISAEGGAAAQASLLPGQRLVSARGDLWRWDGYRVSADVKSQAAIRLEQRNRLHALDGEIETAKAARAHAHAAYSAAQDIAANARAQANEAEQALRQRERALMEAQDHAAKAARAAGERAGRLAKLESELNTLKEARDAARAAERTSAEALAGLPDVAERAAALAEARANAIAARAASGDAIAVVETLRRSTAVRAERLRVIDGDVTRWTTRRDAATAKHGELNARIETMRGELTALDEMPVRIGEQRAKLLDAIGEADALRKEIADARAAAETQLAEADKAARAADHALTESREARAGAQARAESARARLAELGTRIRDELDANPDELAERAEWSANSEMPPLDQAEAKVEKLKREREQLGGVNLRAEEEAVEHEQRLTTLQADRADLDGAIQRLRRGIQSLNREGRERLLSAFEKVNTNFERLFKELFQGGEARLTFTESDDPLEAGLEILARPPGKKLTTLSLLSGGEQALTAVSLIFAVFLVNPAPICVLDEVDAPLDDANVDRFCRLLDEMTRLADTRFLVISHHALTMSRMDRLFGVTMAERGVSQLVSVSLADAERVAAA